MYTCFDVDMYTCVYLYTITSSISRLHQCQQQSYLPPHSCTHSHTHITHTHRHTRMTQPYTVDINADADADADRDRDRDID